jgi:hypothetical protein
MLGVLYWDQVFWKAMLELIFLLIVIPRRMTRLARERNRSGLRWSLAAIGVWIGIEIVVGVILVILIFLSSYLWGTPEDPEKVSGLAYLPALVAGLVSGELMIRHLRAKPALPNKTESEMPPLL